MKEIVNFVESYNIEIVLGLLVGLVFLFILYIISLVRIKKIKKLYYLLTNGTEDVNIEELLIRTGKDINKMDIKMNVFEEKLASIGIKLSYTIQNVGIVRYNAFNEMGSDLSFSLALLDSFQNGFVLTSIYGRDSSSIYAKPIKVGKSNYPLSVEEIQAIDRAKLGIANEIKL